MKWSAEQESECLRLRLAGDTHRVIASALGFTPNSVKHKLRRLQQAENLDKYKHTDEKVAIASKFVIGEGLKVLETHAGFGGLTEFYADHGSVECYDIDTNRVNAINAKGLEGVRAVKADSEREVLGLLSRRSTYDIVDLDPYGMPSRYFPYVFGLINNGLLFITLPMIGVAQMNKITIRHLEAFWGVDYRDKETYIDKVSQRLSDYAFMQKRSSEVVDVTKIDRIYRLTVKVEKVSLCDLVGLTVKRTKELSK